LAQGDEQKEQQPTKRPHQIEHLAIDKDDENTFKRGCCSKHPPQAKSPPSLDKQVASFTHQLIDVDVVKGHQQEEHRRDAKCGGPGCSIADQWTDCDCNHDGHEQCAVSVRRKTVAEPCTGSLK